MSGPATATTPSTTSATTAATPGGTGGGGRNARTAPAGGGGRSGGGRGPRKPSSNNNSIKQPPLIDILREACPAHKIQDLEALVTSMGGDEAKIREKISEWWDEPQMEVEGDWEDVNKRSSSSAAAAATPAAFKNSPLLLSSKFQKAGRGRGGGSSSTRRGAAPGAGATTNNHSTASSHNESTFSNPAAGGPHQGGGYRGGGRGASASRGPSGRGGRDGRGRGRDHARGGGYAAAKQRDPSSDDPAAFPPKDPHHGVAAAVPEEGRLGPNPSMSVTARSPMGAWAKKTTTVEQQHAEHSSATSTAALSKPEAPHGTTSLLSSTVESASSSQQHMLQDAIAVPAPAPSPPVPTLAPPLLAEKLPAMSSGNVWAMRGSAHLIQAEKPPVVAPTPIARKPNNNSAAPCKNRGNTSTSNSRPLPDTVVAPLATLDVGGAPMLDIASSSSLPQVEPTVSMPPSLSVTAQIPQAPPAPTPRAPGLSVPSSSTAGSSLAWNHPEKSTDSLPQQHHTTTTSLDLQGSRPKSDTPSATTAITAATSSSAAANVLNMGRWETVDTDDNLDFAFGFGSVNKSSNSVVDDVPGDTAVPTAASPARPPPGLSMTGMPPMPTNAVLVHELENKLEEVSVSKQHQFQQHHVQENQQGSGIAGMNPASQQLTHGVHHPHVNVHESHLSSQQQPIYGGNQYGAAGAMGMYGTYNLGGVGGGGHSFMNMPGSGVVPSLGQPHQQQSLAKGPPPPPSSQPQQQQPGIYNSAPSTGITPASGNSTGIATNDTPGGPSVNNNASGGMPPAMPGMSYGNPMYYGQQQFHMGQPQPGLGYNYAYGGQFAGGVQGGFGYPGMHGNNGYGAPQYDEHAGISQPSGAHAPPGTGVGGAGGYNQQQQTPQQQQLQAQQQQTKNSGNYRGGGGGGGGGGGRHNNTNQYQTYNQQQQHHQHAGYGAQPYGMGYHGDHFNQRGGYQSMQDPYGMQQQQQGVGNYGGGAGGAFQGENPYKGKKSSRGGLNQFQQQGPPNQHVPGQQSFGLHGQGGGDLNQQSTDGWANQGGSWSGGASGWQGGK